VVVFAATSTDLYLLNNTTLCVVESVEGRRALFGAVGRRPLAMEQFNNLVFATQANVVPQVFDISSASAFSDALGSPPQARYISIVGKFVVLSGLLSNPEPGQMVRPQRRQRRNSWTAGINSSDEQDLADGGFCRGVAGGESGVIMQDTIIRRMLYLPGDPRVFQIEKIAEGLGIYGPYSLVRSGAGDLLLFAERLSPDRSRRGSGADRPRTGRPDVFRRSGRRQPQLFQGLADPRSTRILWVYKSVNGASNQFDKALLYDTALDKFTPLRFSGEFCSRCRSPA
jgi:hypothetical protein